VPGFNANSATARFLFSTDSSVSFAGGSYPGLGITLIRMAMESDGSLPNGAAASVQAALNVNPGILVWSAPWSPSAAFKTTGDVNTGSLSYSSYSDWASVMATTFLQNAAKAGVPIYAISAQNEPDYNTNGQWEMSLYSPSDMVNFIKTLGPMLHSAGVKLIAPESMCWSCVAQYFSAIEADPVALAQVDILASHDYGYSAQSYMVPSGHRLWETEVSNIGSFDSSMTMGIWAAKRIHDNLVTAGVSAFHWWWFDDQEGGTQGLLDGSNTPPKNGFAFGNYSRFIRPGYHRVNVRAGAPSGVDVSAYKGPSGQLVIVMINENGSAANFTMSVANAPSQFTPWVTSAADNLAVKPVVPVNSGAFPASLPAQSVTTFVSP
jgi:glucuronoarabinoxylan endo-1,4-beta-xylanase